jgi:hypothetical protein
MGKRHWRDPSLRPPQKTSRQKADFKAKHGHEMAKKSFRGLIMVFPMAFIRGRNKVAPSISKIICHQSIKRFGSVNLEMRAT